MNPSLQTQLMTRKTRVTEDYWGKICVWWRAPIKVMTLGNCWFDDGVVELSLCWAQSIRHGVLGLFGEIAKYKRRRPHYSSVSRLSILSW